MINFKNKTLYVHFLRIFTKFEMAILEKDIKIMELDDFIGEHILTGVSIGSFEITEGYNKGCICNSVDFVIDGNVYTAIEDPDDGYRSSLKEIICDNSRVVDNIFPPVKVVCAWMPNGKYYEHKVLDFVDVITGKIVLSVGTENIDDYYPGFVSRFHPENMIHNINKGNL